MEKILDYSKFLMVASASNRLALLPLILEIIETNKVASQALKQHFEAQAEFVFPSLNFDVSFIDCEEGNEIVIGHDDNSGRGLIKIPMPARPNMKELYQAWANGESGIPTFTNTASTT